MSEQQMQGGEIDWKFFYVTSIKRWKLILGGLMTGLVLATVIAFFMPKVYQATALILVSPSRINATQDIKKMAMEASGDAKPGGAPSVSSSSISLATHKILLQSGMVIGRVIDRLAPPTDGKKMSFGGTLNSVSVSQPMKSSLFSLSVKGHDPVKVMQLANIWAEEYIKYVQDLIFGEVKDAGNFVNEQFKIAQTNLLAAEQRVVMFQNQNDLDLMDDEINMQKRNLSAYRKEFYDKQVSIAEGNALLKDLQSAIVHQDKVDVTLATTMDDVPFREGRKLKNMNLIKTSTESTNPIYQDLQRRILEQGLILNSSRLRHAHLQGLIETAQKDIPELSKVVNAKKMELVQLTRDLEIAKKTYNNLSEKIEDARIIAAAQLGEVKLISPAYLPEQPISWGGLFMVMIGGSIGLLGGCVLALLYEKFKAISIAAQQDRAA